MTLARYAAIVPVAADQAAVAIACWDAASGKPRLEFTELGTLAPRRATPAWGDPPLLVQLKHDLQACGIKVVTHHVLVPDTDACRRAGLMAMAYAAWSWRRRHTLELQPTSGRDDPAMKACTFTSDWQQHADEPVRHLMTPETISQPWRAEIEVMVYLFSGGMAEADAIAQGEMWRQLGEKLIARGTEMRDMGLGIPEWWAQKCWLEDDEPPKAPVLTLVPKSPAT